jgi:hypothetical protein
LFKCILIDCRLRRKTFLDNFRQPNLPAAKEFGRSPTALNRPQAAGRSRIEANWLHAIVNADEKLHSLLDEPAVAPGADLPLATDASKIPEW